MRALIALALLAGSAHAGDGYQWSRVAKVESVSVSVAQVTELELAALRSKYEHSIDRSALGRVVPKHRYGFALLFRDKDTGAFRCEVYVSNTNDAETLEHELRHCNGWVHQ